MLGDFGLPNVFEIPCRRDPWVRGGDRFPSTDPHCARLPSGVNLDAPSSQTRSASKQSESRFRFRRIGRVWVRCGIVEQSGALHPMKTAGHLVTGRRTFPVIESLVP
jgi:hypothetical protein